MNSALIAEHLRRFEILGIEIAQAAAFSAAVKRKREAGK